MTEDALRIINLDILPKPLLECLISEYFPNEENGVSKSIAVQFRDGSDDIDTNYFGPKNYFQEFIKKQTHYALERSNYKWDEKEKRFENLTEREYNKICYDVIKGFVNHLVYVRGKFYLHLESTLDNFINTI